MKPRSFKWATLLEPGKSLSGFAPSSIVTVPVGQMKLTALVVTFSQIVPVLFATSTRKIYGEPYGTEWEFVSILATAPFVANVTNWTFTALLTFMEFTVKDGDSLDKKVPSPP